MTKQEMDRTIEIRQRLGAIEDEKTAIKAEVEAVQKREQASDEDIAKLTEINAKLDGLNNEASELRAKLAELQVTPELKPIEQKGEKKTMTIDEKRGSKLYERAWAKYCLQRAMSKEEQDIFNEVNYRTAGVAVTTTAPDYVAPTAEVDGVNNGGVFIPSSISMAIVNEMQKSSPFFAGIKTLNILGSVNFPYRKSGTGAKWYAEGTATEDESNEYAYLALSGYELANFNKITWKLENQSLGSFINYITSSLIQECGEALITAVLYGTGAGGNSPTGATIGALKTTTAGYTDLIDEMTKAPSKLRTGRKNALRGARYFVASDVMESIIFAKDESGRYQFNALVAPSSFGGYSLTVDENLEAGDFIFGNPQNYVLNEQVPVGSQKTVDAKYRRNDYSAYGIYDGKPIPNCFVYGKKA